MKTHRVIVWDLAGLGASKAPNNKNFSLEKLASDLEAVLQLTGKRPTLLVGHSIGGMTILTFCRLFPSILRERVKGIVLTCTTPTDPVRTTSGASILVPLEKPVLYPLMYLTIALSPLVRLMNILSYQNGTAHLMNKFQSFGGSEGWQQIDFAARFQLVASPAVLARGMIGMMNYSELLTLPMIDVPVLVVAGQNDSTTKPQASSLMATRIPGAQLVVLAPAKHLGLIEKHRAYSKVIQEFANETNDRGLA